MGTYEYCVQLAGIMNNIQLCSRTAGVSSNPCVQRLILHINPMYPAALPTVLCVGPVSNTGSRLNEQFVIIRTWMTFRDPLTFQVEANRLCVLAVEVNSGI